MTTFANVYVGATANDHTGDPIRSAFNKINQNFANVNTVSAAAPVQSVAGRIGNVVLTVNDVVGAASNVYAQSYTMGNSANWNGTVTTIGAALDQLAARLRASGH
jgi:hypothetical protein